MPVITVILEGDNAWPDLRGKEARIIHLTDALWEIATLKAGMKSGLPSASLRLDLPDGRVVIAETSVAALLVAMKVIEAKWGEVRVLEEKTP